jgi:hypothetical protein
MNQRALRIAIPVFLFAVAVVSAQQTQTSVPPQAPPPNDRQGTIVRNVNLVDVLFSVVTKREKLVTDLDKDDFKVFDDNAPQEIASFTQPTDLPLRIGMVLDTSNSIRDRLKFEQDAAIDFLFNAIRRDRDQAFLMTFDDGPEIIKGFTGDSGDLRDTILKQRAGGGTALYDAIFAASEQLLNKSPLPVGPNSDVRRVLVVISDGDDNSSNRSRGSAIEMAQRARTHRGRKVSHDSDSSGSQRPGYSSAQGILLDPTAGSRFFSRGCHNSVAGIIRLERSSRAA